jgi:hypothetical protein
VDPVPGPMLLRKSGSAGNRSRTSGSVARNPDHDILLECDDMQFGICIPAFRINQLHLSSG